MASIAITNRCVPNRRVKHARQACEYNQSWQTALARQLGCLVTWLWTCGAPDRAPKSKHDADWLKAGFLFPGSREQGFTDSEGRKTRKTLNLGVVFAFSSLRKWAIRPSPARHRPSPPARPASEVPIWLGSPGHRRHQGHASSERKPSAPPLPVAPPSAPLL